MGARRDYASAIQDIANLTGEREVRMRAVADALWRNLHTSGVSWVGFYLAGEAEMVLGPCRDKPACSPIGYTGVCGRACRQGLALVVPDVRLLGEAYIACDPRDLSEVAIPLFDEDRTCWGVLDVDSFDVEAFDEEDAAALGDIALRAGLTTCAPKIAVLTA